MKTKITEKIKKANLITNARFPSVCPWNEQCTLDEAAKCAAISITIAGFQACLSKRKKSSSICKTQQLYGCFCFCLYVNLPVDLCLAIHSFLKSVCRSVVCLPKLGRQTTETTDDKIHRLQRRMNCRIKGSRDRLTYRQKYNHFYIIVFFRCMFFLLEDRPEIQFS